MGRPHDSGRRTRLIEAAERLFGHYGAAKTTMQDIAKAARTSVGSVYNEFASKEAILGALAGHHLDRVLQRMVEAGGDADPESGLRAMFHARTDAFLELRECSAHGREMVGGFCLATREAYEAFARSERALLDQQLRRITPDAPSFAAAAVQSATAAFAPPLCYEDDPERLRERLDAVLSILLAGLRP